MFLRGVFAVQKRSISHTNEAAALLIECRSSHPKNPIVKIPPPLNPKTFEDGYEIARTVSRKLRWPVGGFKCAATNPQALVSKIVEMRFSVFSYIFLRS